MTSDQPKAADWPIACATLPLPGSQTAPAETWAYQLAEIANEGFTLIDLTDSWVQPGDLTEARLDELASACAAAGVKPLTLSVIRKSVIDPQAGEANLAYSHRSLEAAARLGSTVVSVGLHRPLLEPQTKAFWFWLEDGPKDATDPATWSLAVARLQDLGRHAESLGLELSLEMYEDTLIGEPRQASRLVGDIGLANVGLNPDLGNLFRLHRPLTPFAEWIEAVIPVTNFWHIKSYFRDEDPALGSVTTLPAPMELGTIDYRSAVKRAVQLGFAGPFSVEHYGGDGLSVSALNARYIRRLLSVATGEAQAAILEKGTTR